MANLSEQSDSPARPAMSERLDRLDQRLRAKQAERSNPGAAEEKFRAKYTQAGLAYRMIVELICGVGVGALLGIGLDALLGTKPWMLMGGTLLGMAAGIRIIMQSAIEFGRMNERDAVQDGDANEAQTMMSEGAK